MTKLKSHNLNLTLHVISTYKYDDKNKRKVRKKEEKKGKKMGTGREIHFFLSLLPKKSVFFLLLQ